MDSNTHLIHHSSRLPPSVQLVPWRSSWWSHENIIKYNAGPIVLNCIWVKKTFRLQNQFNTTKELSQALIKNVWLNPFFLPSSTVHRSRTTASLNDKCRQVQFVFPTVGASRPKRQCRTEKKLWGTQFLYEFLRSQGRQLSNWTLRPHVTLEAILGQADSF